MITLRSLCSSVRTCSGDSYARWKIFVELLDRWHRCYMRNNIFQVPTWNPLNTPSCQSKLIKKFDNEIFVSQWVTYCHKIWTNIFLKIWKIVKVSDPKLKIQKAVLKILTSIYDTENSGFIIEQSRNRFKLIKWLSQQNFLLGNRRMKFRSYQVFCEFSVSTNSFPMEIKPLRNNSKSSLFPTWITSMRVNEVN